SLMPATKDTTMDSLIFTANAEGGSPAHCAAIDQVLCHVGLLVERLLFVQRSIGLSPRTSSASDPLASIVISDEDVGTIFAGFRMVGRTDPARRSQLLADPFAGEWAASRSAVAEVLASPAARGLGLVELVRAYDLSGDALDAFLLALAPDLDARIGRAFGFLNNDANL